MKKILSLTAFAVGALGLASCSDFLDQTSPSEMSQSTVYSSTYYTELRVNKLYGDLGLDETYSQDLSIVFNMNSDIELVDGLGDNATASNERGAMNYNASATMGWDDLYDVWDAMYALIEDCNDVIEGIRGSSLYDEDSESHDEMGRYLGEALTLRAMAYFDLLRIWGDIPLKLETSQPDLSNAYLGKTDRDVIMDTLMVDLDEAIELLPWAGEEGYTTEHVTKGYAHALLAQIAMTRAGYAIRESHKDGYVKASYSDDTYPTERPDDATCKELYERALTHLSAVIQSGYHQLNPSFENEWYLVNQLQLDETYRENIFEIPMGLDANGELGITVGVRMNGDNSLYGKYNSTGKLKLTAMLLYSYDPADTRRDITISPLQIVQSGSNTVEEMLGNAPFALYAGKWDCRKMSDAWKSANLQKAGTSTKTFTGINVIKMRMSNVWLFYAECMLRLTGNADVSSYTGGAGYSARQALAMVHNRAFDDESTAQAYVNSLPADEDGFFDAIVQENAWEFAGEGFRKWDLIRWNLLHDKIVEMKQDYITKLYDGTFQETVYFNYMDDDPNRIDQGSITWYGTSSPSEYDSSETSFGKENSTQLETNLPSISSGLVGNGGADDLTGDVGVTVKNRYLMPISSTTIGNSAGALSNSYGY